MEQIEPKTNILIIVAKGKEELQSFDLPEGVTVCNFEDAIPTIESFRPKTVAIFGADTYGHLAAETFQYGLQKQFTGDNIDFQIFTSAEDLKRILNTDENRENDLESVNHRPLI